MAAWRKEEVDAAGHRQEKREATQLGKKVVIAHGSVEFCEATSVWPSPRVGSIFIRTYYARLTETCVAPVDTPRSTYNI